MTTKLSQARIRELLEEIERLTLILDANASEKFNELETMQFAGGYAHLVVAKAKLSSLKKGDEQWGI